MAAEPSQYMVISGRVAFEPEEREAGGKNVRDITVKSTPKQTLVRLTVWPDIDASSIEKGDFVLAEGKYSISQGNNGKDYHNLSVSDIAVVKPLPKAEREVVNATPGPATAAADDDSPF